MNDQDKRRAVVLGELLSHQDGPNMAAGLPAGQSFEAQTQVDRNLAETNQQGVTIDTPLWARILKSFGF